MNLIKAPIDYDKCSYAFFPGCALVAEEPELAAKAYDALLFQNADTAIFSCCCGHKAKKANQDADMSAIAARTRSEWEKLGKPVMVMACPNCIKIFKEILPEIPTVSLYEKFIEYGIGGGCNSVDYAILHPKMATEEIRKAVQTLAEDMGVKLHPLSDIGDETEYPVLTSSIKLRDMLMGEGYDAAHILELLLQLYWNE